MKKVVLYIVIGIILLAIPISVFVVGQQSELRKKAAPASTISFSPTTTAVNATKETTLNIVLDTATNNVGVIQIHVVFDPTIFEALSIKQNPSPPSGIVLHTTGSGVVESGSASITIQGSNTQPIHGNVTIALLKLKAKKGSPTPVTVRFASDTYANDLNESQNVLIGLNPATITVNNEDGSANTDTQGTGSPTPTTTTTPALTPTPRIVKFGGTTGNKYDPNDILIKIGGAVTWQGDFKADPLMSVESLWPEQNLATQSAFQHTYANLGTYYFYSKTHGANENQDMKGRVIVLAGDTPVTPVPEFDPSLSIASLSATASSSGSLTIDSPTTNETFATDLPTFQGTAAPGTVITLTVHSQPLTVVVTADGSGNWTYTPTTPLEPGPHTIVVTVTDPTTGATQTVTSSFVVDGAGGSSETAIPISGTVGNTLILIGLGLVLLTAGALLPIFVQ